VTHRGPCQPLLFCDSVTTPQAFIQHRSPALRPSPCPSHHQQTDTQSSVRRHAIPRSAEAPASKYTARSILHLIRTFNCLSRRQVYCTAAALRRKTCRTPPSPAALRAWPAGRHGDRQGEDAERCSSPARPAASRAHSRRPPARSGGLFWLAQEGFPPALAPAVRLAHYKGECVV